MKLLELLFRFIDSAILAKEIKSDPERRSKCIRFGVISCINSIVAAALALGAIYGFGFLGTTNGTMLLILILPLSVAFAIASLIFLVNAIAYMALQLSVNRNASGWIALAVLIATLAAAAVVCVTVIF